MTDDLKARARQLLNRFESERIFVSAFPSTLHTAHELAEMHRRTSEMLHDGVEPILRAYLDREQERETAVAREAELSRILDADRHETLVHAAAFAVAEREALAAVEIAARRIKNTLSASRDAPSLDDRIALAVEAAKAQEDLFAALARLDEFRNGKR